RAGAAPGAIREGRARGPRDGSRLSRRAGRTGPLRSRRMTPPRDDDAAAGRATAALPLLERERELGIFAELLGGDPAALSQPLVVEGPAGIGKSRLLAELRELAAAGGYRIAAAQGSELERAFPFGVVRQLFEPLLADASARTELLADAAASAASVFGAPAASGEEEGDQSFATLHGLY